MKHGFSPASVYLISILVEIGIIWSRIWLSGKAYQLPVWLYCRQVIGKLSIVTFITGFFTYWLYSPLKENTFGHFILLSLFIILFATVIIYTLGLSTEERQFIITAVRKKLHQ